jgi:hypothetical protein
MDPPDALHRAEADRGKADHNDSPIAFLAAPDRSRRSGSAVEHVIAPHCLMFRLGELPGPLPRRQSSDTIQSAALCQRILLVHFTRRRLLTVSAVPRPSMHTTGDLPGQMMNPQSVTESKYQI